MTTVSIHAATSKPNSQHCKKTTTLSIFRSAVHILKWHYTGVGLRGNMQQNVECWLKNCPIFFEVFFTWIAYYIDECYNRKKKNISVQFADCRMKIETVWGRKRQSWFVQWGRGSFNISLNASVRQHRLLLHSSSQNVMDHSFSPYHSYCSLVHSDQHLSNTAWSIVISVS